MLLYQPNTPALLSARETTLSNVTRDLSGQEFATSSFPMWVFAQGTLEFLAVNDAAIAAYGFERDEFLNMSILEIRPAEDIRLVMRDALRPREHYGLLEQWRHKTKDGDVFAVELTCHELLYHGRSARLATVHRRKPLTKGEITDPDISRVVSAGSGSVAVPTKTSILLNPA